MWTEPDRSEDQEECNLRVLHSAVVWIRHKTSNWSIIAVGQHARYGSGVLFTSLFHSQIFVQQIDYLRTPWGSRSEDTFVRRAEGRIWKETCPFMIHVLCPTRSSSWVLGSSSSRWEVAGRWCRYRRRRWRRWGPSESLQFPARRQYGSRWFTLNTGCQYECIFNTLQKKHTQSAYL